MNELVAAYQDGERVEHLAARFGIHRTTVMAHLNRRKVARRAVATEWSDDVLAAVAAFYDEGESLVSIGARFGVNASTVANHLRRSTVMIRPRRGWA